jgi:hypothetical protein
MRMWFNIPRLWSDYKAIMVNSLRYVTADFCNKLAPVTYAVWIHSANVTTVLCIALSCVTSLTWTGLQKEWWNADVQSNSDNLQGKSDNPTLTLWARLQKLSYYEIPTLVDVFRIIAVTLIRWNIKTEWRFSTTALRTARVCWILRMCENPAFHPMWSSP